MTTLFVILGQLLAYRVLMLWVYARFDSLLVAILMHASLTASTFVLGPAVVSGLALLVYDVALAVAWWIVVAAIAIARTVGQSRHSPPPEAT